MTSSSGDIDPVTKSSAGAESPAPQFSFPARFVGRKLVAGQTLNDIGLSLLVTDLQSDANRRAKAQPDAPGDDFRYENIILFCFCEMLEIYEVYTLLFISSV